MPLFPQGGGLYPDSIDNSLLADMAPGTVKGVPVGALTSNPVDLTGAQLAAILGQTAPVVYKDCRLEYVSGSIIRLNRFNGCLLTVDNAPQVIPAAGVDLAPTGLTVGTLYYVYVKMPGGVMTLVATTTGPVIDSRNGLRVHPAPYTDHTLVGMVRPNTGPAWLVNSQYVHVRTYYNDPGIVFETLSVSGFSTSSTTPVNLNTAVCGALFWAGEVIHLTSSCTVLHNTAGNTVFIGAGLDTNTAFSGIGLDQAATVAGGSYATAISAASTLTLSEGVHYFYLMGYTTGGQMSMSYASQNKIEGSAMGMNR